MYGNRFLGSIRMGPRLSLSLHCEKMLPIHSVLHHHSDLLSHLHFFDHGLFLPGEHRNCREVHDFETPPKLTRICRAGTKQTNADDDRFKIEHRREQVTTHRLLFLCSKKRRTAVDRAVWAKTGPCPQKHISLSMDHTCARAGTDCSKAKPFTDKIAKERGRTQVSHTKGLQLPAVSNTIDT